MSAVDCMRQLIMHLATPSQWRLLIKLPLLVGPSGSDSTREPSNSVQAFAHLSESRTLGRAALDCCAVDAGTRSHQEPRLQGARSNVSHEARPM